MTFASHSGTVSDDESSSWVTDDSHGDVIRVSGCHGFATCIQFSHESPARLADSRRTSILGSCCNRHLRQSGGHSPDSCPPGRQEVRMLGYRYVIDDKSFIDKSFIEGSDSDQKIITKTIILVRSRCRLGTPCELKEKPESILLHNSCLLFYFRWHPLSRLEDLWHAYQTMWQYSIANYRWLVAMIVRW